ncbi:hypothetical protein UCDDA912_g08357 [Diaporthe ampelina]|uniref:Regulatory protein zeste n=1 Tax=Diaporthe ampelina TaxID=1214573 RepID=A0A0G2FC02_9PEZI|nr:hypothetical protein UCDDA912_g08357 [Diaporthe ampelina]
MFKIKQDESTLRGRYRIVKEGPLPRKPKFTERDNELLLEAVERLDGAHLDNVEKTKTKALWTRVRDYIKKHGGKTTAGPWTLKKKYKELTEKIPEIRKDLKLSKAEGGFFR